MNPEASRRLEEGPLARFTLDSRRRDEFASRVQLSDKKSMQWTSSQFPDTRKVMNM